MNGTATAPPLSQKPVAEIAQRAAGELDRLARRNPDTALAVAAGALVLLRVIPLQWVVRSAAALARPALLALGVCKAYELCTHSNLLPSFSHERLPRRPRH